MIGVLRPWFDSNKKKKAIVECTSLLMVTILISRCPFFCQLCFSFSKKTQNSAGTVFEVRSMRKVEKNNNTGKKLSKQFQSFSGTNSKKHILAEFEEKKKIKFVVVFLSLGTSCFVTNANLPACFFHCCKSKKRIRESYLTSKLFV